MPLPSVEELKVQIKRGKILLPGDDGYDDSLQRWSATCIKPAGVVVMPTSAAEVGSAVSFAAANGISFTVMCGGHSSSGSSSSDGGMVIHLGLMRNTDVDLANRTITFDGGCLWKDVNAAAAKHGLATVGGIVGHTGVGGLTLGGGYGHLTGRHGLAIDCLLSVEMVLADGSIVQASNDINQDLFWAVRGAGASFGVVTQFTSKLFPQGDVWGGILMFPINKVPDLIEFTNSFLSKTNGDDGVLFTLGYHPVSKEKVATLLVFYNGPQSKAETAYAPLLAMQPMINTTGRISYPEFNALLDQTNRHGRRYLHGGSNFILPLSSSSVQSIADQWFSFLDESHNEDFGLSRLSFELQPRNKICAVPLTETSCANRGEEYNVSIMLVWENSTQDQTARNFCREMSKLIRETVGHVDDDVHGYVGIYNNYRIDAATAQDAFGSNAKRLMELKAKYDPNNLFDKQLRFGQTGSLIVQKN